jgi:hypothetical protein
MVKIHIHYRTVIYQMNKVLRIKNQIRGKETQKNLKLSVNSKKSRILRRGYSRERITSIN